MRAFIQRRSLGRNAATNFILLALFSKLEWEAWRQKNPPSLSFSSLSVSLSPLSAKWNGREKRKSAAVGPKFTDRVRNRESDIHPTLDSALDKGHSNLELGGGRILRSVIFSKTKWKRKAFGVGNLYFDCGVHFQKASNNGIEYHRGGIF